MESDRNNLNVEYSMLYLDEDKDPELFVSESRIKSVHNSLLGADIDFDEDGHLWSDGEYRTDNRGKTIQKSQIGHLLPIEGDNPYDLEGDTVVCDEYYQRNIVDRMVPVPDARTLLVRDRVGDLLHIQKITSEEEEA